MCTDMMNGGVKMSKPDFEITMPEKHTKHFPSSFALYYFCIVIHTFCTFKFN